MTDPTGTTYWNYDARGQVVSRVDAFGATYCTYDDAGRRTAILNADGEGTYYQYDAANRVSAVISPYGEVTYYEYLANDLTQCALLGNGVGAYYEYDLGNRITSITHRRVSDGADLGSFYYQYDHNSNRTQLSFEGDAVPPGCGVKSIVYQYSVSSMDRLETENYLDNMGGVLYCLDYRYDLNGNRTLFMRQPAESGRDSRSTYYEYNELNQLTRSVHVEKDLNLGTILMGATYFDYDLNGNTVQRVDTDENGDVTGATYYTWDPQDQLTGVQSTGGVDNTFAYDGGFQRVEREDAAGTTKYNWDGLNVLLEHDASDNPTATHTHGPVPVPGIGTHLTTRQHGATP